MKNRVLLLVLTIVLCVVLLTACGKFSPSMCSEHKGETACKTCGLVYFDELIEIVKTKSPDDSNSILAETDNVDYTIKYNEETNSMLVFLVHKTPKEQPVVFLMTMKPTTGSTYGWALSYNDNVAGGTFDAKQVKGTVFEPTIEYNEIPDAIFADLDTVYKESVSFCADVLYSLLKNGNTNNLTIQNLGFENYTPNV